MNGNDIRLFFNVQKTCFVYNNNLIYVYYSTLTTIIICRYVRLYHFVVLWVHLEQYYDSLTGVKKHVLSKSVFVEHTNTVSFLHRISDKMITYW